MDSNAPFDVDQLLTRPETALAALEQMTDNMRAESIRVNSSILPAIPPSSQPSIPTPPHLTSMLPAQSSILPAQTSILPAQTSILPALSVPSTSFTIHPSLHSLPGQFTPLVINPQAYLHPVQTIQNSNFQTSERISTIHSSGVSQSSSFQTAVCSQPTISIANHNVLTSVASQNSNLISIGQQIMTYPMTSDLLLTPWPSTSHPMNDTASRVLPSAGQSDTANSSVTLTSDTISTDISPSKIADIDKNVVVLHIGEIDDWNSTIGGQNVEVYVMDDNRESEEEIVLKEKEKVVEKSIIPVKSKASEKKKNIDPDFYPSRRRRKISKNKLQKQFICHVCGHESKRKAELVTHLRTHTGEKPFNCPFCEKSFARQDYLDNHIRIHTGEKPFVCPVCEKCFSMKVNLNKHLMVHTSLRPFQCDHCLMTFRRKNHLKIHYRKHSSSLVECPICRKKLKIDLKLHMKRIHKDCSQEVESENESNILDRILDENEIVSECATDINREEFNCTHCAESFSSHIELMEHIDLYLENVRRGNENGNNMDTIENETGSEMNESEGHAVEEAETTSSNIEDDGNINVTIEELLNCPETLCDAEEVQIINDHPLTEHDDTSLRIPSEENEENEVVTEEQMEEGSEEINVAQYYTEIEIVVSPSVVEEVTDALRNQAELPQIDSTSTVEPITMILEVGRDQTNQIMDPDCQANEKNGAETHDEFQSGEDHENVERFQEHENFTVEDEDNGEEVQEVADDLPTVLAGLARPVIVGQAFDDYVCGVCSMKFKKKCTLIVHQRIHTGEKPYQCETCGKQFKDRANYTRHVRIHTGEKPYKCSQCPAAFARNTHLKNHVRKHDNKREFACDFCEKDFNYASVLAKHAKTHGPIEEDQYPCEYCDLKFSTSKERGLHMKSSHVELRCGMCEMTFTSSRSLKLHEKMKHSRREESVIDENLMEGLDDILESITG